ncbi:MAG: dihydroneopterin aldolase [Neisseriaceae bacterium]
MDTLRLLGIQLETRLGVYPWEQYQQQILFLDLALGIEPIAARTDCLEDAVDYEQLVIQLREHYYSKSFKLLEALAEDIAFFLLSRFRLQKVKLYLVKPGILGKVKEIGIEIERTQRGLL